MVLVLLVLVLLVLVLLVLVLLVLVLLILILLILILLILVLLVLILLILLLLLLFLQLLQGQLQIDFGILVVWVAQQGRSVIIDCSLPVLAVEGSVAGVEVRVLRQRVRFADLERLLQLLERFLVVALAIERVGGVVVRLGQLRRLDLRFLVSLQRFVVGLLCESFVAGVGELWR